MVRAYPKNIMKPRMSETESNHRSPVGNIASGCGTYRGNRRLISHVRTDFEDWRLRSFSTMATGLRIHETRIF